MSGKLYNLLSSTRRHYASVTVSFSDVMKHYKLSCRRLALCVVENFAKSLKVTHGHLNLHR